MKALLPIGETVLSVLSQRHHPSYVAEKRRRLLAEDLSTSFEILFWATHALDDQNRRALAEALGISISDLEATGRVLKTVYNGGPV